MNHISVDKIAAAVLYEGYILYPYRPSVKNRQRWTFGGLYPRAWADANGDASSMRTECLAIGGADTVLTVTVRFLHLVARTVGEISVGAGAPVNAPFPDSQPGCSHSNGEELEYRAVESLRVGDRLYQTWQEAAEHDIALGAMNLRDLTARARWQEFSLPASLAIETLRDAAGTIVGVLDRRQQCVEGSIEVNATPAGDNLFKVTVNVVNRTQIDSAERLTRDDALMKALVSTHAILGVRGGEFVSLTDPPVPYQEAAASCKNAGCWPVLVGNENATDALLASPIILPDYPRIAPESPGDLFDGGEIDEILTLRILTLTDDEKRTAVALDDRAKSMVERTTALTCDQLMRLHGRCELSGAGS